VKKISVLQGHRYVGDTDAMVVHDRWHEECEDCLMEEVLARGVAVGFGPDTLEQALWEGFEYCPYCIDRTDPEPPRSGRPEGGRRSSG
jgi:hypothetical protein